MWTTTRSPGITTGGTNSIPYPGIRSAILAAIDRTEHPHVLEVGYGTGKWLAELASAGCDVAGVDPSREMLRRASAKVRGDLRQGSAEALPWGDALFDVVFYINSFHHFAAPQTALRETFRVLRPGGKLLSVGLDPHEKGDRCNVYEFFLETLALDLARFPSRARRISWLQGAGFMDMAVRVAERLQFSRSFEEALRDGVLEHLTMAKGGIRESELFGLQRDDLDFAQEAVWIRRGISKGRLSTPKNGKVRRVDLSAQTCRVLQDYLTRRDAEAVLAGKEPSPWLFPRPNGEPMTLSYLIWRVWYPALDRAGLRRRGPHQLRHTYASLLIAQGAHPKYIQEQLGHSSIRITLDLYGHLFEGDHRRYVEGLDSALDATCRNPGATAESVTAGTPTISSR